MENFWKKDGIQLKVMDEDDLSWLEEHLDMEEHMLPWGMLLAVGETASNPRTLLANRILDMNDSADQQIWFLIQNEQGARVGYIYAARMNERVGRVQLKVLILPSYRRHGYGRSAVAMLVRYFMQENRYVRVAGETISQEAFLRACGFVQEGVWKEQLAETKQSQGMRRDIHVYAIVGDKVKTEYNKNEIQINREEQSTTKRWDCRSVDLDNLACGEIHLEEMDEECYARKHQIMYDAQSSRTLDGVVALPRDPDWITEWESAHCDGKVYRGCREFAIVNRQQQLVGTIGLDAVDEHNASFSYNLYVFADYAGRGYGRLALRILFTYAFVKCKLYKMYTYINAGNEASRHIVMELGARQEGCCVAMEYYGGQYVDAYMYGLTRPQFLLQCGGEIDMMKEKK